MRIRLRLFVSAGLALGVVLFLGGTVPAPAAQHQLGTVDLLNQAHLTIHGAAVDDQAGTSVAGAGDVNGDGRTDVIVGAPDTDPSGSNSGAAYVLYGKPTARTVTLSNSGIAATDGFLIEGAAADSRMGESVAGAGDVNGDGFADVIVGASQANTTGAGAGAVYVLYGAATRPTVTASDSADPANGFLIKGAAAGDQAGKSVAGAGDVNGDGRADLIVGAPFADTNGATAGAPGGAYVLYGQTTGTTVTLSDSADPTNGFLIKG